MGSNEILVWYVVCSVRIYRRVDLYESIGWIGLGLAVNRMLMGRKPLLLKNKDGVDKAAVDNTEISVEDGVMQTIQESVNHKTSSPKKQSRKRRKRQNK